MQALALMTIFVFTAAVFQFVGFLISQLVDYQWPAAGLMTFLVLFLAAYAGRLACRRSDNGKRDREIALSGPGGKR